VVAEDDPFTFLDIDNGIDPETGEPKPWAQAIVDALPNAYWEVSTTGTGLKGLVRGRIPRNRIVKVGDGQVELFFSGKFTVLTGNRLPGSSSTIGEGQEALSSLYAQLCPEPVAPPTRPASPASLNLDDSAILERCRRMPDFNPLYDRGDLSRYGGDHSNGDLGLANYFAVAGANPVQIDRLLRSSALYREKWERKDYRERTIAKALDGTVVPFTGWDQNTWSASAPFGAAPRPTVPASDPCGPVRDELAELRAENARLRAELAQTRRDLSAVIKVIGNPNLGGDAAGKALVLAATYVQAQRARVHSDDGYYRVTASKVADNTEWIDQRDEDGVPILDEHGRPVREPVPVPAQVSPRTVTKYMDIAATKNLIPAEKRTVRVPKGERDFPVDVWHWKAAPTLADQLAPLTGASVYDDDNPRPVRGGDPKQRRLAPIPGCPDCGSHQVACASCGTLFDAPAAMDLDTRETLTEDEVDAALDPEHGRRHTVPTTDRNTPSVVTPYGVTSLQSAPDRTRRPTVLASKARQQARVREDLDRRAFQGIPPDPPPDVRPTLQALPGMEPPPPDHRTDVAYGARR
jgi:hypothetical protein